MENLKRNRGVVKGKVSRFNSFLIQFSTEDQQDLTELRFRKANFEKVVGEFEAIQVQIEASDKDEDGNTERDRFETEYFKLLAKAENFLAKQPSQGQP